MTPLELLGWAAPSYELIEEYVSSDSFTFSMVVSLFSKTNLVLPVFPRPSSVAGGPAGVLVCFFSVIGRA